MIEITQTTQISPRVAEKAKRTWVRKLNLTEYVVKPRLHGRTRRLVTFTLRRGNRLTAECRDFYAPYQECEANRWGNLCYHSVAALRRMEINLKREERKAA